MNELQHKKAQDTLINIASAIQHAGGCVSLLKDISLSDFIKTCAHNNIEITVKYKGIN